MSTTSTKKSVLGAVAANFLVPGVGYIYVGRIALGIAALVMWLGLVSYGFYQIHTINSTNVHFFTYGLAFIVAIDGFFGARRWNRMVDDAEREASMMTCPSCAEKILRAAKVCRYCQRPTDAG